MSKKSSKKVYIRIDKPIEVGDLVRCVRGDGECKPGDIRKVSRMGMDSKVFFYAHGSREPRWQEFWEPVRKGARVNENHRADMKREVAEMIVELLDKDGKHDGLFLTSWEDDDKTVGVHSIDNKIYKATLSPSDTWDTLTGVYVALCKATGRKLPDWIYGGEKL